MDKQQAKYILQNTGYIGNEVGVAFDVAIKSMDKLDKIEQIIKAWNEKETEVEDDWYYLSHIAYIFEKE